MVSATRFVDVFDLPNVDQNIGTCRNQVPVVLVINSRTSQGYGNDVKMRCGLVEVEGLTYWGRSMPAQELCKQSFHVRQRQTVGKRWQSISAHNYVQLLLRFLHDTWVERHSEVESICNGIGLQDLIYR